MMMISADTMGAHPTGSVHARTVCTSLYWEGAEDQLLCSQGAYHACVAERVGGLLGKGRGAVPSAPLHSHLKFCKRAQVRSGY